MLGNAENECVNRKSKESFWEKESKKLTKMFKKKRKARKLKKVIFCLPYYFRSYFVLSSFFL